MLNNNVTVQNTLCTAGSFIHVNQDADVGFNAIFFSLLHLRRTFTHIIPLPPAALVLQLTLTNCIHTHTHTQLMAPYHVFWILSHRRGVGGASVWICKDVPPMFTVIGS